jgi:hypothetical protein
MNNYADFTEPDELTDEEEERQRLERCHKQDALAAKVKRFCEVFHELGEGKTLSETMTSVEYFKSKVNCGMEELLRFRNNYEFLSAFEEFKTMLDAIDQLRARHYGGEDFYE